MRLAHVSCYVATVHRFGSCMTQSFLLVVLLLLLLLSLRDIPRFFVCDERSRAVQHVGGILE